MSEHAVVIAGGGPAGMMLAAELALAKVDVAVLERRPDAVLVGSRAGGFHSRTIELLDQRGVDHAAVVGHSWGASIALQMALLHPERVTRIALYDAWVSQGYERGPLGLPTSAEIQEPLQLTQNFAHGTLNFERLTGNITEVLDGIRAPLPTPGPSGPTVPAEHFSLPGHAVSP